MDLSNLRISYKKDSFIKSDLSSNPFDQFKKWFEEARNSKLIEPNAMCLATTGPDNQPRTRIVLLKEFSRSGLIFFTNYDSDKAKHIKLNNLVSVNFLWHSLQRQINIEGKAEKIDRKSSESYFHSRPRGSQLGAHVSNQSSIISSRKVIEDKLQELEKHYHKKPIPLPKNWGGIRIIPNRFEFWQGRDSRLHDRMKYTLENSKWIIQRLAP